MSRHHDRAAARPLPPGLRICETCGEARGRTPDGWVSACFCSGVICNRCGERRHRPITDYYDRHERVWVHVPYFALDAHTCRLAPGEAPHGKGWTHLPRDPEVVAAQAETTRRTWAALEARTELNLDAEDRRTGHKERDRPG